MRFKSKCACKTFALNGDEFVVLKSNFYGRFAHETVVNNNKEFISVCRLHSTHYRIVIILIVFTFFPHFQLSDFGDVSRKCC